MQTEICWSTKFHRLFQILLNHQSWDELALADLILVFVFFQVSTNGVRKGEWTSDHDENAWLK